MDLKKKTSERTQLRLARLRAEKCELKQARACYEGIFEEARQAGNFQLALEALAGLLRLAGESLDEKAVERWDRELDWISKKRSPFYWFCKGMVSRYRYNFLEAQRHFHRFLNELGGSEIQSQLDRNAGEIPEFWVASAWLMLAHLSQQRNHVRRSRWIAFEILRRYQTKNLRGINGMTYLLLGTLSERERSFKAASQWFQKADVEFLREHNWYNHLYALYGHARIARKVQNFAQAGWYLELVDQVVSTPEFGLLKKEIQIERQKLRQETMDLVIDRDKREIRTRETGPISLGKQFVLLDILEALTQAHHEKGGRGDGGLSKEEMIRIAWGEDYQPKVHDNKLYYNINRLRKLIEPDVRKPQYLLNSREGYRFAPGLKIKYIGSQDRSDDSPLKHFSRDRVKIIH